jgi:Tol biopolymer transport system component
MKNTFFLPIMLFLAVTSFILTGCHRHQVTASDEHRLEIVITRLPGSTITVTSSQTATSTNEPPATKTITPSPIPHPTLDPEKQIAYADRTTSDIHVISGEGDNSYFVTSFTSSHSCTHPNWSPDGTEIVFSCYVGANSDIYIAEAEGILIRRITYRPEFESEPIWSPDGESIAFATYTEPDGWALDILTLDTDRIIRVFTGKPRDDGFIDTVYSWSPDSSSLVLYDVAIDQLFIVDASGDNLTQITFDDSSVISREPAWSPRYHVIVYSGEGGIRLFDPNSNGERIIISGYLLYTPYWAPNGDIVSALDSSSNPSIHFVDLQSGEEWRILEGETILDYTWAPDSSHMAFISDLGHQGQWSIYTVNIYTEEIHELISVDPELFGTIDWQP